MEYKVLYQDGFEVDVEIVQADELPEVIKGMIDSDKSLISVNPTYEPK